MRPTATLTCLLAAAAAVALAACAEKSAKPKEKVRTGSAAATAGSGSAAKAKDKDGDRGGAGPAVTPSGNNGAPVTLEEAKPKLTASLAPIADKIEEAMKGGCMQGADRVAALFRDADDAADDLHVMMRDPALRAELADAIKARQDRAIAKAMSRIDTALVGCPNAFEQAKKGMERLLQPAIAVPQ